MDCRGPLSLLSALVLVAAGCTLPSSLMVPETPPTAEALTADSSKEANLPKITPKPATLVAFGQLREEQAAEPTHSPREQELLREEARRAYQHAIQDDPDYLPAYRAMAAFYLKQKDYERAQATYQNALSGHPTQAVLWYELGMCYARQKQWDSALESLHKAVSLDPESRPCVNTLGYCLARAGHYEESLECFRKVGPPAEAHYNLARMLLHLKQEALARQHLELAVQADPDLAPARELLAQLTTSKPEEGKSEEGKTVASKPVAVKQPLPIIPVGFDTEDNTP